MSTRILVGDARATLRGLADNSVHCVVTSPPYYGLRRYLPEGHPDAGLEVGAEESPDAYVAALVQTFRDVRRVLRADGTLWLNLGDSFASAIKGGGGKNVSGLVSSAGGKVTAAGAARSIERQSSQPRRVGMGDAKPKDLLMIPARVALALQADGWWIRQDIIWSKDNCMPESAPDRPTTAHEHVFLLTRSPAYFYDSFAIAEPCESGPSDIRKMVEQRERIGGKHQAADDSLPKFSGKTNIGQKRSVGDGATRNRRSVWRINPQPFSGSHFATMPPLLAETCILAGTSESGCCPSCGAPWERIVEKGEPDEAARRAAGADAAGEYHGASTKGHAAAGVQDASAVKARVLEGMRVKRTVGWRPTCGCPEHVPRPCVVLDPFAGAGTTLLVADRLRRDAIGIELNESYAEMARARLTKDAGLFAEVA